MKGEQQGKQRRSFLPHLESLLVFYEDMGIVLCVIVSVMIVELCFTTTDIFCTGKSTSYAGYCILNYVLFSPFLCHV